MKLPSDYLDLVRLGATALHSVGARLRGAAVADEYRPELWLAVRDLEGLAGRLVESTAWEWQHGIADLTIAPQDHAVLNELVVEGGVGPVRAAADELTSIARLREFLRQYSDGVFDLDDPAS